MANAFTPDVSRPRPFTEEDSIGHTRKYAERAFGAPLSEIGNIEMQGTRAALVVPVNGTNHILHWQRQPGGQVFWFADGSDEPLRIGPPARALAALVAALS